MGIDTRIELWPGMYRISSSRFDAGWVSATKALPIRTWTRPFWQVPSHSIPLNDLGNIYNRFGSVRVVNCSPHPPSAEYIKKIYPQLYDFQATAVAMAMGKGSFLIAHEMGCGKTYSCLAAALQLLSPIEGPGRLQRILIVCPASVQGQWQAEISRWTKYASIIIRGSKKTREKLWANLASTQSQSPLLIFGIISYESLRQDWPQDLSQFIVIGDELSKIKNNSKIAKVFREMAKTTPCRIGATGTPISGKLDHYYNIMRWINPGWMSYDFFDEHYTVKDRVHVGGGRYKYVTVGYRNLDDFVRRLDGFVDRKLKSEIGVELPPKTIEWRRIAMNTDQSLLHNALVEHAQELGEGILPVWQLLHTVSDGTEVTLESTSHILRDAGVAGIDSTPSPKLAELDGIIEEIGDKKVLIYTQFSRFARHIHQHLNASAPRRAVLATGEDQAQRDESVRAFREDPEVKYLVSTDTLAMGVSFSDIDYEIQADIPADISTFLQRCDRIHRIDSTRPKTIIVLYSEGVEEDIYNILHEKALLNELVAEGKALTKINIAEEVSRKYGIVRKQPMAHMEGEKNAKR